ncbi:MAG TPA: ABC transporter substrate-binding protein [Xanthobacteraceae bacterium]|jgi:ABC-type nitrate/sulfonate/bicarbonate transport system substrate-binding protein
MAKSFARALRRTGIALALAIFAAGAAPANAAELVAFRVGEAAPANTFLAIWMAQAAGFYETEGLQVAVVPMIGGSQSGPALKSGQIHLMHIGMSSVVRANTSGLGDLRCIGSLSNVIRSTMFTAPGVRTAADLKGKVIGISSVGSESDSTTTLALQRLGLSRNDVIVQEIGVDRFAAVREGRIAATVLGEPSRSEAFAAGLNPIFDFYAEHIPWLYSGLTVDRGYLKDHRATLMAFLKATIEGNYLAVTDERRAKEVLAKELKLTDPKLINTSYANFKAETPPNAEIDRAGAENILATVAPANASHNLDDYIDTSLTDQLRAQGFIAAMEKKYGSPR